MPPSQLKRLKSSLREQGITGPQKSKKQKRTTKSTTDQKDRHAQLQHIRDSFNPFELRSTSSRPPKFDHVSLNQSQHGKLRYKDVLHRPGVSKSAGEEMRRRQLLPEMQRRNKVGGVVDRRIGEGDAGMTPEERAVQRFAREKERRGKGSSLFDLEGSDEEARVGLTHLGKSLDDFDDGEFAGGVEGDGGSGTDDDFMQRKRKWTSDDDGDDDGLVDDGLVQLNGEEEQPERKKTKKEVMEEVIAKSKFHKYERQKAKEDDEDLREELDKGLPDLLSLLKGKAPVPQPDLTSTHDATVTAKDVGPKMNPDRQALLDGMDRAKADKEYEVRLRQLAQDAKAKPSERSKTAEEKAAEEAEKLRAREEARLKRMVGLTEAEDGDGGADSERGRDDLAMDGGVEMDAFGNEVGDDEAAEFGFASATSARTGTAGEQRVLHEDEDEFAVEDDLIASGSDAELSDDSDAESSFSLDHDDVDQDAKQEDEEDEFVKGILGDDTHTTTTADTATGANATRPGESATTTSGLSYTYPCPRSHAELLDVVEDIPVDQIPTVIQRIRALHHPSLNAENRDAMKDFSQTLVKHLSYMANTPSSHTTPLQDHRALAAIEQVIRHLHSLSRTYPTEIAEAFREQLREMSERVSMHGSRLEGGDLLVLTAIGSIYPTSDHFHQVVTPAVTLMGRWLGLHAPSLPGGGLAVEDATARTEGNLRVHATGAFLVALCVSFQKLSKRYVPEALRFTLRALDRAAGSLGLEVQVQPHLDNLLAMADLWREKTAFVETFAPAVPLLQRLAAVGDKSATAQKPLQRLLILLSSARLRRRPLELHHHRPQPLRTSIPKFQESYNPDFHYDPDKDRSEKRKLEKEYKRERKGAVRELRKDANFVGREMLRSKRERDEEHERKERRLIAEIQGEEGREAKEYEREKRRRKAGKGRG